MRNFAKLAGVACAALGLGVTGANAVPVEWTIASGGNGHFYDFIEFEGTWGDARADALALSHNGQAGYLITLTSADEQAFYIGVFGQVDGWIGANDIDSEGVWLWADGPEAGQQFWSGGSGGSATGPFNYASWGSGQPDDSGGEDAAQFGGGDWIDLSEDELLFGYLIEYNAAVTGVPEPVTLSLLGSGLLGVAAFRRMRRA
ncbi:MAG: PEP-CTERM sorting domain-containing protein [Alphaproteobacteria bacterium]|nr:PEP-CTERM sorting domain-containing protein [Alphaproteobacteria bacterium]